MRKLLLALTVLASVAAYPQVKKKTATSKPKAAVAKPAPAKPTPSPQGEGIFATMETSKGTILLRLDYKSTPVTVANFVSLAEGNNPIVAEQYKGKPFYDGLKFHRVIADFMIQGGDPMGTGAGDPGYKFKDEITDAKFDRAGLLAMANAGPATNGSQFFITHKDTPWLNGRHTIFGSVVTGQDVVNAIKQDDLITKVTISRNGADAKAFDAAKVFATYYANKDAEERDAKRKQQEAEEAVKREYDQKYGPVKTAKVQQLAKERKGATKTASGLEYKIIKKGTGKKPESGKQIYVHYAGFLEDGSLFDSSYADVTKTYGKFDERRGEANYQPFPFEYGKKDGLIPGFIEALEQMSFGDKLIAWIPSKLGYGERGAGKVIPPNANIIFEIEMLENLPTK